jgi:hypothetical protein
MTEVGSNFDFDILETSANDGLLLQLGSKSGLLRVHRVARDATADERLHHLKSILKSEFPDRPLQDIEDLKVFLEEFLKLIREKPQEICWRHIDDFSYRVDERKSKIGYPIINQKYFERDLQQCLTGNEAVQRRK